jgi:peptidoglycan hydrolase-like protein with peptidoglycan-binding domain
MPHFTKTLAAVIGVFGMVAMLAVPVPAALAQTTVDNSTLIAQLTAQIAALQAQLNALLGGGTTTTPWCHTFSTDLKISDSGDEVGALQTALGKEGFLQTDQSDANPMGESGPSFGEPTAATVVSFQQKYGIRTTGYVGPLTRAKLNALYGCGTAPNPAPNSLPTSGGVKITACMDISSPGQYVLDKDIVNTSPAKPCLNIHDTSGVQINFAGHSVDSKDLLHVALPGNPTTNEDVLVTNVNNFEIDSCVLKGELSTPKAGVPVLRIVNSNGGAIVGCNSSHGFGISGSSNIRIAKSHISDSVRVISSQGINLEDNSISAADDLGAVVTLSNSKNNVIARNSIDGRSDGVWRGMESSVGADDGIVTNNEIGDAIQDNVINNVFDCGVEGIGPLWDSKITGNKITNAGFCGIGAWFYENLKGNLISANTVDSSNRMFMFFRSYGIGPSPNDGIAYFKDNIFSGNKFTNPKALPMPCPPGPDGTVSNNCSIPGTTEAARVALEAAGAGVNAGDTRPLADSDIVTGNNLFKDNDFGTTFDAPFFSPKGMIVDGGGNVCKQSSDAGYPIRCSGSTVTSSLHVTAPNGGETWVKGTTQSIQWQDKGGVCPPGVACATMLPNYLYTIQLQPYYPPCTSNPCPAHAYQGPYTIAKDVTGSSYSWTVGTVSSPALCEGPSGRPVTCQPAPDGAYTMQVCRGDTCDASDSYFKITSLPIPPQSGAPVISGVSGPTTLAVGQQGTWTVSASDPKNGSLYYSVVWGDEALTSAAGTGTALSNVPAYQQTASFTHTYNTPSPRPYMPVFTVANSVASAQTSVSVNVGGSVAGVCPITAKVVSANFAENNTTWGFDVLVNATNAKTSDGWTTNFQGYAPEVTAYGVIKHYGNFFLSSGPLQFAPHDKADASCMTTVTAYPPVFPTPVPVPTQVYSISLAKPAEGEQLAQGSQYRIDFPASYGSINIPQADVYLLYKGVAIGRILNSTFALKNVSSYTWQVGQYYDFNGNLLTAEPGPGNQIKANLLDDNKNAIASATSGTFSTYALAPGPAPTGGQTQADLYSVLRNLLLQLFTVTK